MFGQMVRQIASRIAVMLDGRIVEEGPAADALDHPATDYTRALLAAAPRFQPAEEIPA